MDVLHLRELVLLCLLTICPPPRCSVVRLLEWDRTLVHGAADGQWTLDSDGPVLTRPRGTRLTRGRARCGFRCPSSFNCT